MSLFTEARNNVSNYRGLLSMENSEDIANVRNEISRMIRGLSLRGRTEYTYFIDPTGAIVALYDSWPRQALWDYILKPFTDEGFAVKYVGKYFIEFVISWGDDKNEE